MYLFVFTFILGLTMSQSYIKSMIPFLSQVQSGSGQNSLAIITHLLDQEFWERGKRRL